MRIVSAMLVGIAAASGVDVEDIAARIDERFRYAGNGQPRRFRSDVETTSMAGSMQRDAARIELDGRLPYIAGFWMKGDIRLTGVQLHEDMTWYGESDQLGQAQVTLFRRELPESLFLALKGRRVREVIDHPVLAHCDETILGAARQEGRTNAGVQGPGHLALRITNGMTIAAPAETKLDRLQRELASAV